MPDNRIDGGDNFMGQIRSPAGFVFGVQGWQWPDQKPSSITFFLDGTAKVCDQLGRPIKGTEIPGSKPVFFAQRAPLDPQVAPTQQMCQECRKQHNKINKTCEECRRGLATHAQVVAALTAEHIKWQTLLCAGFPQLPYDELVKAELTDVPPVEHLRKISDPKLRADAIKLRRELDAARDKELATTEE